MILLQPQQQSPESCDKRFAVKSEHVTPESTRTSDPWEVKKRGEKGKIKAFVQNL